MKYAKSSRIVQNSDFISKSINYGAYDILCYTDSQAIIKHRIYLALRHSYVLSSGRKAYHDFNNKFAIAMGQVYMASKDVKNGESVNKLSRLSHLNDIKRSLTSAGEKLTKFHKILKS